MVVRSAHRIGQCTNPRLCPTSIGRSVQRGSWFGLRNAKDGDDPAWAGDPDLSDKGLDECLPLTVAACGDDVVDVAARFRARKTVHAWLARYEAGGRPSEHRPRCHSRAYSPQRLTAIKAHRGIQPGIRWGRGRRLCEHVLKHARVAANLIAQCPPGSQAVVEFSARGDLGNLFAQCILTMYALGL